MPETYRIGDLATRLDVSVETIRYYEREGLLPKAGRSGGNYRIYSLRHRQQLEFILHCRALDMTHEEIRELLRLRDSPDPGCAGVNELLDAHILHVAERLRALRSLQAELKAIRAQCSTPRAAKDCGILQELALPAKKKPARGRAGVHDRHRGH